MDSISFLIKVVLVEEREGLAGRLKEKDPAHSRRNEQHDEERDDRLAKINHNVGERPAWRGQGGGEVRKGGGVEASNSIMARQVF